MHRAWLALVAPLLIAAAPLTPGTEADRAVDWLIRPDESRVFKAYPKRAIRLEQTGEVTILCTARLDTTLGDCKVESETPEGFGFGAAALDLASEMRMSPAIRNGTPVEETVRIPLSFTLPQGDAAVDDSDLPTLLWRHWLVIGAVPLVGGLLLLLMLWLVAGRGRKSTGL